MTNHWHFSIVNVKEGNPVLCCWVHLKIPIPRDGGLDREKMTIMKESVVTGNGGTVSGRGQDVEKSVTTYFFSNQDAKKNGAGAGQSGITETAPEPAIPQNKVGQFCGQAIELKLCKCLHGIYRFSAVHVLVILSRFFYRLLEVWFSGKDPLGAGLQPSNFGRQHDTGGWRAEGVGCPCQVQLARQLSVREALKQ